MAVAPGEASAEVDGNVTAALALIQQGRAGQAYEALRPLLRQRAGDPDYDFALGLAAADSGRPAEAITAFQRVLSVQPDNAQAQAELARAYALAGDADTARSLFDTVVQDPSLPDPVRQRFNGLIRDMERQISGGRDVSGFVDIAAGYDSNVNAATDLTQITIPLFAAFGPGALAPGARAIEDAFVDLNAGVSAVYGLSRQTRVFGSVLGNYRQLADNSAFDQMALTGTTGVAHTLLNRNVVSASAQAQQIWVGQDEYRTALGVVGQYTHRLAGGQALTVAAEYFNFEHESDPLRDADRIGFAVGYVGRSMVASLGGGHSDTDARAADHLSHDYIQASFGIEHQVTPHLAIIGGGGVQRREHDADDPLFLTAREDTQIDASLGLKFKVLGNAYVRPRITYTNNDSNIPLYAFDRLTASVGLRAEF